MSTTGRPPCSHELTSPIFSVKPTNYDLSLHNLELSGNGSWSYDGSLQIELEIRKETDTITLNTHELKIHSATISTASGKTEGSSAAREISYDLKSQRCIFHFDQVIQQAPKAILNIEYTGTINNNMAGFYRSKYKPTTTPAKSVPTDGENYYMFSTQFESSDARRAFPCFDEPNLKASFDLSMEIPEDQVALSNMPVKETTKSEIKGLKKVAFETSPVMSTYLFSWAFGDFEYVEDFTRRKYNGKNLPVRVYTTKGLKDQGKLALDAAHQVVDYFSEVTSPFVRSLIVMLTSCRSSKLTIPYPKWTCLPFMSL